MDATRQPQLCCPSAARREATAGGELIRLNAGKAEEGAENTLILDFDPHAAFSAANAIALQPGPGKLVDIYWTITLRGLGNLRANGLAG